jgi:hypothetical protein
MDINNMFTRAIFSDMPEKAIRTTSINWAKRYPFQDNVSYNNTRNFADNLKNKIIIFEKAIEKYTKDNLINRSNFVELAVKCEIIAGWDIHFGIVAVLGNGFIFEAVVKAPILPPPPPPVKYIVI